MKKITICCMALAALLLTSCATSKVEDTASNFEGAWVVEEFVKDGAAVTGATANIEISAPEDGIYKVFGNTGINTFLATDFTIKDNKIAPVNSEAVASTLKAGSPEAMAYEDAFKKVLLSENDIALVDGKLVISNDTAKVTFVAGEPAAEAIEE